MYSEKLPRSLNSELFLFREKNICSDFFRGGGKRRTPSLRETTNENTRLSFVLLPPIRTRLIFFTFVNMLIDQAMYCVAAPALAGIHKYRFAAFLA